MFTSGRLNKHRVLRHGAEQILKLMASSNGRKRLIAVAPRIGGRNSNGEWNLWSGNWSARCRRTSACESNWKKPCGPTNEVPRRFPRGNPRVTQESPQAAGTQARGRV